jgi:uroporphyrinogen-III synthase
MNRRVFISRNVEDCPGLIQLLEKDGWYVQAQPLIETEQVPFTPHIPKTDWIFFSSAQGVKYFFSQNPNITDQKIACVGQKTAAAILPFTDVDFVGDSIDTLETAQKFAQLIQGQSVLFPISENSLRNIQSALPTSQVFDLICYRTLAIPKKVEPSEVLVFSSPSNVSSFFKMNQISETQTCLAFGFSTQKALSNRGINKIIIPTSLSDQDIFDAIKQSVLS